MMIHDTDIYIHFDTMPYNVEPQKSKIYSRCFLLAFACCGISQLIFMDLVFCLPQSGDKCHYFVSNVQTSYPYPSPRRKERERQTFPFPFHKVHQTPWGTRRSVAS